MDLQDLINGCIGFGVIYMFTSLSGKSYIGQSINFKSRYKKYKLNNNSIGKYFKHAISKYDSIDNFELEILAKITPIDPIEDYKKELNRLEIFYIEKYDTFNNGYNLTAGGLGSFKREVNKETRKKLSQSNKGKNSKPKIEINCGECNKKFKLRPHEYKNRLNRNIYNKIFCSRSCGSIHQSKMQKKRVDKNQSGLISYDVGRIIPVTRY